MLSLLHFFGLLCLFGFFSAHSHVLNHVQGSAAVSINEFVPKQKLFLHVRCEGNHVFNRDGLVSADAVQPELVHSLLVDVEIAAQLVIVNLLAQHFRVVSDQLELAGEIWNFCWVRDQNYDKQLCAVTFTHVELILHEDRRSDERIRRLKEQLDIFHPLEIAKLSLDFRLNCHKLGLKVGPQEIREIADCFILSSNFEVLFVFNCSCPVTVLWV